jgi:hypothetical protein
VKSPATNSQKNKSKKVINQSINLNSNNMKKISLIILLSTGVVFGVLAQGCCSKHDNHSHNAAETLEVKTGAAEQDFQKQLKEVYQSNLKLNEALVASDMKQATTAASNVKDALKKVDMKLLQGQDHQDWMQYLGTMNENISAIAGAQNLDAQRKAFAPFSEALYKSIKQFGVDGEKVYFQYCPMALNNQGGHWLSSSSDIQNPYYGSRMLKCGTTKEVL